MHGIGNDFIVVDALTQPLSSEEIPSLARQMNDRRFGIGGDGLLLVEKGSDAPYRMTMLNPDGSNGGMCGNGVRCVARFLREHGYPLTERTGIEVTDRTVEVELTPAGNIRVDMGIALLKRGEIGIEGDPDSTFIDEPVDEFRGTGVSMGNPHIVVFTGDVAAVDLVHIGPRLENHALFPNRTNVHFVQVLGRDRIRMRTWERGAGITLACGSGSCACAVGSVLNGRTDRTMTVELPGGSLSLVYEESGRVFMEGPAKTVFEGEWTSS